MARVAHNRRRQPAGRLWHRGAALLLALALLVSPAAAGDFYDRGKLDTLFDQLRHAPSFEAADTISGQIWALWTAPDDPELAARLDSVMVARGRMDFGGAIALLDKLLVDYPDYSEGWNQRATLYYMLGNYTASLADIDQVLVLEPRHFGALAGRVMIHLAQGNRELALREMIKALQVHPFLRERQLFPELQRNVTQI
jgi:tetratricopeptide (TPR) repeat protein